MSISSSSTDYVVDRRRMRRQVTFWRALAFVVVALAIIGLGWRFGGLPTGSRLESHIARVTITGLITGDQASLRMLREIRESNAKAVLLSISSPGGTTVGAERLYDELRLLAAKKPVVAVVGTMAASGAYIAALGSDRIFAQGNSLVGSIGVLVQYPNFAGLLDKIGVKYEAIKSSPLKASPNCFEPTSEAARAAMASLVNDSYDWFKTLVKDRRSLSDSELAAVDDGRVFTGRQGLPLKLIDAIGGQRDAVAWLERERGVAKGLPILDWKPDSTLAGWAFFGSAAALADWVGLSNLGAFLREGEFVAQGQLLDGLVSIWQLPNRD